ncbi:MAG TPA: alpha/beta hydrolase [Candidatus Saccharimonadales bacterium]|nr:alpha/beta hydrolase [Candidatus Saccharimonadales bacterium]
MKALILHGTASDHMGNWFPWLKTELEKLGLEEVWVPDLPGSEKPNVERYTKFLLSKNWDFDNTLIIGHSSGAVEVLDLLENLPEGQKANTAIMVAVFKGGLGWESLKDLETVKFDYDKIKSKAKKLIVVHSDDDPHCPIDGAREIAANLSAQMQEFHGMKHFSISTDSRFTKFPELLEIIKRQVINT